MTEKFTTYNFQPFINKALEDLQFVTPTPVQEKLIPIIRKNNSVVGQSETGSGKTHAFLLPLIDGLQLYKKSVQVVITTPSRELAYQIYDATKQIVGFSDDLIIVHNYVGGTDKKRQIEQLSRQQPQIVIGTPGRIMDLIKEQALDVHEAQHFVIDEADMTLDMGFLDQVDKIAGSLPEDVQMLVFSATIPEKLRPFLKKYMSNPVIEEIPSSAVISPTIDNWLLSTKGKSKEHIIYQLLTMGEPYLALVFANTKTRVDEITDYLLKHNLKVAKIHGGMTPRERKRVMRQIHNLDFQFVVATDLAARGIDIEGVSLVINDDIPTDLEFFIHRVGRTGRNKMSGTAITLYEPDNDQQVSELEKMGIAFKPKEIKNGEIADTYNRNRRDHRKAKQAELDPTLKGFVKKTKKKVKPGYKKKIRGAISEQERQKRKLEKRHEVRQAKRNKKKSSR
ncbi:DEAD/DEAH box helicase [Paucilactobacillus suebicus]|uniref:DEAD-box ATP-dependent RNA helicase CshB n=1 Tax=Paucilactobacillus suebicus DSM 5007 = KCTC 3549 TaxID=1423807 RepID=A0A0R1W6I7_9LACO|nr:DEAD/DEAH box helicase [Paucilactobacillus suebicus]KRM13457.1 DEAD DEAH box helicase [Paucilactobacillus suebicus DSM 5007 = KCTC 3549]